MTTDHDFFHRWPVHIGNGTRWCSPLPTGEHKLTFGEPEPMPSIEPVIVPSMAMAEVESVTWAGAEFSTVVRMWGVGTEYAILGGRDNHIVTVYPRDGFDSLPSTASSKVWLFPPSEAGLRAAIAWLTDKVIDQAKAEGGYSSRGTPTPTD